MLYSQRSVWMTLVICSSKSSSVSLNPFPLLYPWYKLYGNLLCLPDISNNLLVNTLLGFVNSKCNNSIAILLHVVK